MNNTFFGTPRGEFTGKLKPLNVCLKAILRDIGAHMRILVKNPDLTVHARRILNDIAIDTG